MFHSQQPADYRVHTSELGPVFNRELLQQFLTSLDADDLRQTHYFNDRYENIYLEDHHAPRLRELKREAKHLAAKIMGQSVKRMGCWFNAMGPGAETTLHSHDDDDERLSGVYYVRVPEHSGDLIIHGNEQGFHHLPREGQWVFFSPATPHEVTKNRSGQLRLSVAFNFC